jgi:hypothetical protein
LLLLPAPKKGEEYGSFSSVAVSLFFFFFSIRFRYRFSSSFVYDERKKPSIPGWSRGVRSKVNSRSWLQVAKCMPFTMELLLRQQHVQISDRKNSMLWTLWCCRLPVCQTMQHGYGYVYQYRKDTHTRIRHFSKRSDTWIRFNYFLINR